MASFEEKEDGEEEEKKAESNGDSEKKDFRGNLILAFVGLFF